MPPSLATSGQHRPNPLRGIRSAQQHAHRQQHVGHRARPTPRPPRPHRLAQSLDRPGPAIPPPTEHTVATRRTPNPTRRQPGLDAHRIDLYRDHRCLRALQRGTPQASQDFSGVPRTHQFLVTLTVHTNTSNPGNRPTRPSPTSLTNPHQVVFIQRDGQHARRKAACSSLRGGSSGAGRVASRSLSRPPLRNQTRTADDASKVVSHRMHMKAAVERVPCQPQLKELHFLQTPSGWLGWPIGEFSIGIL
jgi:hypothetical protein